MAHRVCPGAAGTAHGAMEASRVIDRDIHITPAPAEPTPTAIDAALAYATARGWYVFPVPPGTKASYVSMDDPGSNGRPWGATTDPDLIRQYWTAGTGWPRAGVGIATGVDSGVFVIECDTVAGHERLKEDGAVALDALQAEHGKLPDTLIAMSPSGSVHRYYKHPGAGVRVVSRSLVGFAGVDCKGDNGMVIAPPTMRSGRRYRWVNDLPVADAPQWLIDMVAEAPRERVERSGDLPLPLDDYDMRRLCAAVVAIPNADVDWDDWNRMGMALWAATDGSDDGLKLFDYWSRKSRKSHARGTPAKKWEAYFRCPPDRISIGSIFYMADAADPEWRARLDRAINAEFRAYLLDADGSVAACGEQLLAEWESEGRAS